MEFPLTANPNDEQSSSPAVVNGVVYFGSDDGSVFALNASTGERLWENGGTLFPDAVLPSPAVANGMVHVGTGEPNGGPSPPPSTLLTLNASTGAVLWSFAVGAESFVQGSPTVTNRVVYFGAVDPDGNLYALNASTGAKVWSFVRTLQRKMAKIE
jgi:outer membrane protein assembly factor BamB